MKKIVFYGILIFIFSIGVGFVFSKLWVNQKLSDANLKVVGDELHFLNESNKNIVEAKDRDEENLISNEVLQASAIEEKILPTAEFAMKKVYNECGHFKFEYAELPQELVNLTEEELEAYYKDWEIEEFSPSKIILTKEINSLCDEHFIIKLGEKYVQVFHLEPDGNLVVYETTDISREYLPEEDIKKLEEGIYVFGEGMLNSVLEDFE